MSGTCTGARCSLRVRDEVDRAGGRAGADAEGQFGAARHVADEEVGLVGADVPGLGREAARVVLLQPDGRGVGGGGVEVEYRGRGIGSAGRRGMKDLTISPKTGCRLAPSPISDARRS